MILADTSVWIEHLRRGDSALAELLEHGSVLGHPWVVGELALGHLAERRSILRLLSNLPQATVATPVEVLALVERHALQGTGIGYVDAQLLAAVLLTPDALMWTHDKRLAAAAAHLGRAVDPHVLRDGRS